MFLVWLGELISERGIGNGVSILILGGIVARVPSIFSTGIVSGAQAIGGILLLAVIAIAVVALIVLFQEAQRRIPVQYARSQFRGGRLYRQQGQSHIPLRVNSAGNGRGAPYNPYSLTFADTLTRSMNGHQVKAGADLIQSRYDEQDLRGLGLRAAPRTIRRVMPRWRLPQERGA